MRGDRQSKIGSGIGLDVDHRFSDRIKDLPFEVYILRGSGARHAGLLPSQGIEP
jgi:hypothetical protein